MKLLKNNDELTADILMNPNKTIEELIQLKKEEFEEEESQSESVDKGKQKEETIENDDDKKSTKQLKKEMPDDQLERLTQEALNVVTNFESIYNRNPSLRTFGGKPRDKNTLNEVTEHVQNSLEVLTNLTLVHTKLGKYLLRPEISLEEYKTHFAYQDAIATAMYGLEAQIEDLLEQTHLNRTRAGKLKYSIESAKKKGKEEIVSNLQELSFIISTGSQSGEGLYKGVQIGRGLSSRVRYFSSVDEAVKRLEIIIAGMEAGNNSKEGRAEASSILSFLKNKGVLNAQQIKNIKNNYLQ